MALVCAGAIALPAWQTPPAPALFLEPLPTPVPQEPVPVAATPPPQTNPYQKWLTEDVAYIIQDAERAAFQRLNSTDELEHFIEQFWGRRGNDVKEEHYRRIAYANERFADGRVAGWKTDRGRTYIVYGPPDEKEIHPDGEAGGPPYEEWLYRRFQGGADRVMRFENRASGAPRTP
jgi:GWxTD domain-containing protein